MGDRIVVMKDGVIQQADTPDVIYHHPANVFVAGFIGSPSMNFIHGRLEEEAGKVHFKGSDLDVKIPEGKAKTLREKGYVGKEVIFGIRPEDIHDEPVFLESSPESQVKAKVEVAENMGSEMYLYLSNITDKWVTARVNARNRFEAGNEVTLALDMNKGHIFDKETEEAVF
ncbi:TOBE domain-containing protein [Melghirimyces profundicolus]|uniref:TOBE domain-containing protein n=1 Tax=Melghirimyces profundicolus TaxID=1242148 RepID=A0A2T6BU80_9BACL|nr:TOBE domain-containing protein [Melghirimyces profundicolus]